MEIHMTKLVTIPKDKDKSVQLRPGFDFTDPTKASPYEYFDDLLDGVLESLEEHSDGPHISDRIKIHFVEGHDHWKMPAPESDKR